MTVEDSKKNISINTLIRKNDLLIALLLQWYLTLQIVLETVTIPGNLLF